MKRRDWLQTTSVAALAAGLAACGSATNQAGPAGGTASDQPRRQWKMVTTWPANFPGLGTGAALLAELITRVSGGRLSVRVYAAGELVPAFETFDAVSRGTAEMGHSAAYYWSGKSPAAPFFCAVPFGLNAQEMNGWLYYGGGLELWRELYAGFNLVPFPAGNTGVQAAGWFKRELGGVGDLRGLKMRIPGLGGEVIARLGAVPVNLPGSEIFTALQSGAIDAAEWVGPYNDLAFGLHRVAKHCYFPGWQEPGPTLECMVNKTAFDALPEDLQAIVDTCCRAVNDAMLAEYTARNQQALVQLREEHGVQFHFLPDEILAALEEAAEDVLEAATARDPLAARIHASQRAFRDRVSQWHALSEASFYRTRSRTA
jgi:TRAP-type mannitol/chloroaromatic compound transport system substrate-binding protein